MLDVPAEHAIDGPGDKTKNGEQEQKRRKRGPIGQAANSPTAAPALENPANRAIAETEKKESRTRRPALSRCVRERSDPSRVRRRRQSAAWSSWQWWYPKPRFAWT